MDLRVLPFDIAGSASGSVSGSVFCLSTICPQFWQIFQNLLLILGRRETIRNYPKLFIFIGGADQSTRLLARLIGQSFFDEDKSKN